MGIPGSLEHQQSPSVHPTPLPASCTLLPAPRVSCSLAGPAWCSPANRGTHHTLISHPTLTGHTHPGYPAPGTQAVTRGPAPAAGVEPLIRLTHARSPQEPVLGTCIIPTPVAGKNPSCSHPELCLEHPVGPLLVTGDFGSSALSPGPPVYPVCVPVWFCLSFPPSLSIPYALERSLAANLNGADALTVHVPLCLFFF